MHWLKMPGMPVSWDDLCRWPVWRQVAVAVLAALAAAARQAEQADRALLRSLILRLRGGHTTTAELWKMAGGLGDEA
ncbi:hypothetical protein D4M24_19135 [Escherichia coli]|nr:hypothetical protein D4M24_19135 [Escherichia coli]